MTDDLYHDAIMAAARSGRRAGRLAELDASATIDNPLCGDRVTIDLKLDDTRIVDLAQHVRGCALCQASAAVIAGHAVGRTPGDLAAVEKALRAMLSGGAPPAGEWAELAMFQPVRQHRSRHDCVLLPFAAVQAALKSRADGPT